jgi:ABC-type phosphate transport system substrate-binding protein
MRKATLRGASVVAAAALAITAAAMPGEAAELAAPVAIVVHPDTPVSDLSFTELRRIFLGEQQFWDGSTRITLLVRPPRSSERAVILDRVYEMNEGQFRQYWIAKLFRAEVSSGPKLVYSNEAALELVAAIPGAISFLDASVPTRSVKVLRIDGVAPGERGYKLQ